MKYLITLKPLEPFMFGGEQTFGELGDKEAGSYLVKSRHFPQQTALLGMLRKEMMTQAGLLTRKRRGEWVDKEKKSQAFELVGNEKFSMLSTQAQNLGKIKTLGPIFLKNNQTAYIKKVDIDTHPYENGKLKEFDAKTDIYDNFISVDGKEQLTSKDIFEAREQTGNKKGGEENSLFKKTSFLLKEGFAFAFYADIDFDLNDALVMLGADRSSFMMSVKESNGALDYLDPQGYLTLLSDSLITVPLRGNCDFAITSEISHRNLKGKKTATQKYASTFQKTDTLYLYEKGSVFINPSQTLIANLDNANLRQIGYNIYTIGENK